MSNLIFLIVLMGSLAGLLFWGFRHLPREQWQILAVVPGRMIGSGIWEGMNLTFYGVFNALAYTVATGLLILLLTTIGVCMVQWMALIVLMTLLCLPAARIIARIVEQKTNTFTVAGAAFAGMVFAPIIVLLLNIFSQHIGGVSLPLLPVMAALGIAYCFGEGIGRLACISFGCCYGRPMSAFPMWIQRVFSQWYFVFTGKSKKIAYAHHLDGHAVFPIQAVTSVVLCGAGCLATGLYLRGDFTTAFLVAVCVEKLWRWISEFFRADFRGTGSITAYQWLSLASIPMAVFLAFGSPAADIHGKLDIVQGLHALWSPHVLLFLEIIAVAIFLYTGRSRVTGSHVEIFVHGDRI